MELSIENKITKTKDNIEIDKFTKELSKSLNKEKEIEVNEEPSIYEDLIKNNELAKKYKSELKSTIKDVILERSIEEPVIYLKKGKNGKHNLYYIEDEEITKLPITAKEIKEAGLTIGKFYNLSDNEKMMFEYDYIKDYLKEEVVEKLEEMEKNNGNK